MVIKTTMIDIQGGQIPVTLEKSEDAYIVKVDGVFWFEMKNQMHAVVLHTMMAEHLTEYMHYEKV